MENNREPRNKFIQIQSTNFWLRQKHNSMEKKQPIHQIVLEKLDMQIQNLDKKFTNLTKINSKWFKRPKYKIQN